MSTLREVSNLLSTTQDKLFGGLYTAKGIDNYDVETDELHAGITWVDLANGIHHIFGLDIYPEPRTQKRGIIYGYIIVVSYFKQTQIECAVTSGHLLTFLREAKFNINSDLVQLTWDSPLPQS